MSIFGKRDFWGSDVADSDYAYESADDLPPPDGPQPEISDAIERFRSLPLRVRTKRALLWWLLGRDGTPPYKITQTDSEYRDYPCGDEECENCASAYLNVPTGVYICSDIRGEIELQGWCNKWRPPPSRSDYVKYQG